MNFIRKYYGRGEKENDESRREEEKRGKKSNR